MTTMPEPAPNQSRAWPMVLALVAVFVAPILIAWWLVGVGPPSEREGLLNHGTLIQPPLDVGSHAETQRLDRIELKPGEWAMMYVGPGRCEADCDRTLDKLATIRTVLGQGAIRVRIVALIDEAAESPSGVVTIADRVTRSFVSTTITGRVAGAHERGIVFLDWRQQIMMYFDIDAPPGDIKKDIKRLLRASKIR